MKFFGLICLLLISHHVFSLQSPYIETELPGKQGKVFAPGLISLEDRHEFGSVFSPDGKEFFFAYVEKGKNTILALYYEDGK